MSKPVVAIVGRPNVGKSTLFNALAGERISIVQDTPGVTRDRIYAEVSWLDHNFTILLSIIKYLLNPTIPAFSGYYFLPVEPNPPSPRSVSFNSSTSSNSTERYGITTICAMRSFPAITRSSSVSLCKAIINSPR